MKKMKNFAKIGSSFLPFLLVSLQLEVNGEDCSHGAIMSKVAKACAFSGKRDATIGSAAISWQQLHQWSTILQKFVDNDTGKLIVPKKSERTLHNDFDYSKDDRYQQDLADIFPIIKEAEMIQSNSIYEHPNDSKYRVGRLNKRSYNGNKWRYPARKARHAAVLQILQKCCDNGCNESDFNVFC